MKGTVTRLKVEGKFQAFEAKSYCLGKIVRISKEGRALVDFPENSAEPVEARTVVDVPLQHNCHGMVNIPVLLFFENGAPKLPIIIGVIRDSVLPIEASKKAIIGPMSQQRDVSLDGKKMIFEAKEEIVLRCGKSSVTLKKDGKIVVKGTQITNRASATNKIKGASVQIN